MNHILVFKLDGKNYGIFIEHIDRIVAYDKIRSFPWMGDFIEGIILYQQNLIPVVQLEKVFGIESNSAGKNQLIVVQEKSESVALHVNEVRQMISYEEDKFTPSEGEKYVYGSYEMKDGESLILIKESPSIYLEQTKQTQKERL